MVKYIKFDEAQKTLRDFIYECNASGMNPDLIRGITHTMEWLDRIPLEDVAPVVHGRWIERRAPHAMGGISAKCSACNKNVQYLGNPLNYCPNCGAKMDGGAK